LQIILNRSPRLFALIAGFALTPIPAVAKPIYLTCDFTYKGKPQPRKFTFDEDRGRATIFYPETAESQTLVAQFTDQTVLFETYVDRYGINRTSLVGVRQDKLDGAIDKAQCRIVEPEGRAF
jgi:hypothetical protein